MLLGTNLFTALVVYMVWVIGVEELFLFALLWFSITVPKNAVVVHSMTVRLSKRLARWGGESALKVGILELKKTNSQREAFYRGLAAQLYLSN